MRKQQWQYRREHMMDLLHINAILEALTEKQLFVVVLLLRLTSACLMKTYFVPDETWQSTEVAHKLVFGYGFMTWEWIVGLRTYMHPLMFAFLFHCLKAAGLDNPQAIIIIPRIAQAILTGLGEWYFYQLIKKYFGGKMAVITLTSLCLSWCWFYCGCRTLINTIEAALTCVALYFYPWEATWNDQAKHKSYHFTVIASVALILRPTSAIIWLPLYVHLFFTHFLNTSLFTFFKYIVKLGCIFSIIFVTSILTDRWCYGRWVFVHYKFLQFNVLSGKSVYFGRNEWHWYITQGVPIVTATHLPLVLHGIFITVVKALKVHVTTKISRMFLMLIIATIVMYSFIGHKEFRFILNLIPLFCFFCGVSICSLSLRGKAYAMIWLASTNVPMAYYFSVIHQSGPDAVLNFLQQRVGLADALPHNAQPFAFFLMPCHSTPYYSYLHHNLTMQFLTCHESLKLSNHEEVMDEDDQFYSDPRQWLEKNILNSQTSPTGCSNAPMHIVLYDSLLKEIRRFILQCYNVCFETFHTHFPERRIGRNMIVLCKPQ